MDNEFPIFYEAGNSGWYAAFWVSCPIPELDMSDEWVESLPVPDEDELILMDMNAEVLEDDFTGE